VQAFQQKINLVVGFRKRQLSYKKLANMV
jgi:hypothetical protein